ncbi:MAG: response regulator transcription factor [Phycisphaerales bacterium]
MKHAAVLTTQVMAMLHRLPGIATLDWCDRAAKAACLLHEGSAAAVALCCLDRDGFMLRLESVGAAGSGVDLGRVRSSFRQGEWIGWKGGAPEAGRTDVNLASVLGLLERRGEGPVARRWELFSPGDVLLGAGAVPGEPGRVLLVELALPGPAGRNVERELVVLGAAMPFLIEKLINAVGAEPADERRWLTAREEIVLWQLVAGKKVPQIAEELGRSVYTVHDHVKSLHRKLGATSRGQLVSRALGHLGPLNGHGDAAEGPSGAGARMVLGAARRQAQPS